MTCIVGVVARGRVYIGADSASVQGWTRRESKLKKVFRNGPFLIGYTTSFRMGQLLEHQLTVPRQDPRESDMAYLVNRFAESVRVLLKDRGFAKVESNNESGGQFLVGYRGSLYTFESDFQVAEMADHYDAIGSGAEFALGALAALPKLAPRPRIKRALAIASHFSMGVCAPFHIASMAVPARSKAAGSKR